MTAEILKSGETMEMPIVAGQFSNSFTYIDTRNTADFANNFTGKTTNDVFYKFTLANRMSVIITHCGSVVSDTYMTLLDANGLPTESNDNYSGDGHCANTYQSFIRRDLEAGTYYIVSEGNYSNGEITTTITGYFDEFNYSDIPDYYSTESGTVGETPGELSVSETGASAVTIPIEFPAGVGGMQPSLAIVYNSQAANGIAGWGANIAGISAITRTPKSIYYDGTAKGLTYLGDDAYLWDGKRLIYSTGTAGQEGAEYYPESDPFTKITVHGTYSGSVCSTWFEVQANNGMKYIYGNTSAFRQTLPSGKVTAWYLSKVEDPLGNYMEYSYTTSSYYIYPSAISYGKNSNQAGSFENKVEFTYETRPDLIPFILDGTNGSISNRLSNIKTKTGSTTYREYQLQYTNTDNFSRLSTVTEKNGSGETLKPVQLDWNPLPSFYQQCVTTTVNATNVSPAEPVAFSDQQFLSGDLNGDGIYDLISTFPIKTSTGPGSWSYNNCVYIYWGSLNSSGFPQFLTNSKYIISASFKIDGWTEQKGGCSPIDFNGDGIDEILIPNASINEYWKTIEFWFYNGTLNNSAFAYSLQYSSEMPAYATGDFNNDGKGDIIYIEKGQNGGQYPCEITGLNQGTTLYRASLNLTLSSKPEKIFVSDYNGDGLQDVLVFYSGGYKIFWNKGNGISTQTLTNSATYSGTNIGNSYMVRMGDFNGDGLADFIMNESGGYNSGNSSWYFAINNGNGTFTKNLACSIPVFDQTFTDKDNDKFNCEVFDFDNDGKTDVIITKAMYDKGHDISGSWGDYRETLTYWMRSTGSTLTQVGSARSTNENDAFSRLLVSGDFNGDGKVELMNYGYNCYNASSTTQTWRYYNNPNISASSGLLTSVTSGMGRTSSVSYGTLTKSNIYTKGTGATYPVIDVTLPLSIVNSSTFDNGSAGTINQTYTYKGAKVHLQGKGFLGFMVTTANNTTQGVTTENGITSLNTTWYAPSQTYTKITVDGDIATTTVDYTYVDKGSKKYFAYPASKTEKDLDGNTYSTSRQYNTTDGYLTDERTEYGNSSMYRKAELRNYIKAGGRYQPQLIKTIQKHADDNQEFSRQTSLTYDASKGYTLTKVENYGTTLALTTEYLTYDSFGNLKASTVSGLGVPTLTTYTDYDATNRFPAKVYTSPASIVSSFTYDTWGNTLTEKDETNTSNILTTTHVYDNWGKRSSTTTPDGRKTQYREGWNNDTQKKYFTLSMGDGQPWVKQWYDCAGRETVTETIGAKGLAVSVTKNYNSKGQNTSTDNKRGSLTITDNFQYDARGRLTSQSSTGGQSNTYGYGNRQTTVTRNGQQYTKTYDAWGNLLSSTDPLSSVSCQYKSVGKPMQVTAGGALFTMDYDAAGNQNQLVDPNAGTISYTYDAAGRLKTQDDARSKHYEVVYDAQGRIDYSTLAGTRTEYDYGTTGYDLFMLTKMTTGSNYLEYHYDQYGRVQTEKHQINGAGLLEYGYTYNSDGLPETTTYPGGVQVSRTYDGSGNLETVSAGGQTVWALANATGLVTTANLGGAMNATTTLNQQGLLTELKTVKSSTVLRDLDYQFNPATGNLDYRTGMLAYQEKFDYDGLDRLISVKNNATGVETMGIGYADNGNITSKTGLGTYAYTGPRPHAITELDNTDGLIQSKGQHIAYTDFNKAVLLEDTLGTDAYRLDIAYGPDQQRCMSVLKKNGATTKTTVFGGDYEKITLNGVTRELYYIGAGNGLAAVLVKQAGQTDKIYYTHTDHLGSILSLTDQAGNIVFAATYDAWGKQTISQNTIGFARGYTGHEHLSEFGLIDMNGRMYDALLGRFLSTDNYVQMPDFSQNFNRYGYCLNNPLKYTDPSGEAFGVDDAIIILAMAYFGGMQSNFFTADNPMNPSDWNWSSPSTYIGIGSGALSGAGMAGLNVPTLFPNLDGMITRGAYQAGVNVGLNGIGNAINGDPFFDNWGGAALSGFASGAVTGYQLADVNGKNLWWGSEIGYNRNKWSFFNSNVWDYEIGFGIPNVGSNSENDCVPTTFAEIERKRGGSRTYDDFKKSTNYQQDVGVTTTQKSYETLVNNTFNDVQKLATSRERLALFDPQYMQNAANNNEVFSVHFGGKAHADNVRSLRVFINKPSFNTLTFRQSSYNFTISGKGVRVWNIFRFF